MLCWLVVATAAPLHTTPGSLFGHDAVALGPDGTTYALVAAKQSRLGRITSVVTVTDSDGQVQDVSPPRARLLVRPPGGAVAEEAIPGPGGVWGSADRLVDGALALDAAGRPVVAMLGENCPENTPCSPRLWVAVRTDRGWETDAWALQGQSYRHVLLDATGERPEVVVHRRVPDFAVVVHDGGGESPWFVDPSARPDALVVVDGQRGVVYRSGQELRLRLGDADEALSDGAAHRADATVAADGLYFQHYRPDDKRLHGGRRGDAAAVVDAPESGWHNALTTHVDGAPLAAWYAYRNNWNKGVVMGHRVDGAWQTWSAVREEDANIGWGVDVASSPHGVVLVAEDRSDRAVHLWAWPDLASARAAAVPPAGDWTDRRRTSFFFVYGGGWFQMWDLRTAAPSAETFSYGAVEPLTGSYGIRPGVSAEAGVAGKIGPVDVVMEIMRRSEDDEAFQTIDRLQNLMGQIGIDDLPLPDSEMQLHVRLSDLQATYEDVDGAARRYDNRERQVELRYVGKAGYHFGLRYRGFRGPQDVYVSQNKELVEAFVANAKFTEGSFVAGWSVLDYLKKYEIQYFGPYLDAQVGAGMTAVNLRADRQATAFTVPAGVDVGLAAYRRSKALHGFGGFVRLGLRGTAQFTASAEPEESDPKETYNNFNRRDLRAGPYANVGLVF